MKKKLLLIALTAVSFGSIFAWNRGGGGVAVGFGFGGPGYYGGYGYGYPGYYGYGPGYGVNFGVGGYDRPTTQADVDLQKARNEGNSISKAQKTIDQKQKRISSIRRKAKNRELMKSEKDEIEDLKAAIKAQEEIIKDLND